MREKRIEYRNLVWKFEELIPLVRPRYRCEDNIKVDLQEMGYGDMEWMELVKNKVKWRVLVNSVMNFRVL
jgi:hypothetical protein